MTTTITLTSGATEADIQAAISSLPSGGTLILPPNETILISSGLKIDAATKSIKLDLNGSTLQQAGDISVISVNGSMSAQTQATLGRDGDGNLTVSASGLGQVQVGDWVKVLSDDALPHDHGAVTRLGQAMKVIAVTEHGVTLEGEMIEGDLYTTNVRVSHFRSGTVEIENGTVRGEQGEPSWNKDLIHVRSTIDTHFDGLTVRDGNSMGINFVNTVNALVTQSAVINLTDDTANGHYGYGVHSASSLNTTVNGLYAEAVRHAVDDNAVGATAGHRDTSKYGADIGLTATNVVANANTAFAFSWHSEGRNGYVGDSVVFNSHGVIAFRGMDHVGQNISGSGNARGIQFYEYGNGDGQRNVIDNMHLKENGSYVYTNSGGNPHNNTISNSTFEMTKVGYKLSPDSKVLVIGTEVKTTAPGDEIMLGTAGDDRLLGGAGDDVILGGVGRDYIWGGLGADVLAGGAGADRFAYLDMNEAGDVITDFGGGDVIDLSALAFRYGWTGDLFANGYVRYVQSGSDTLVQVDINGGGDGFVTLATLRNVNAATLTSDAISTKVMVTDYTGVPETFDPFAEFHSYNKVIGTDVNETLDGGSGEDLMFGGAGNDRLFGNDGDDVLVGGAGADFLHGGAGHNTASYANSSTGLTVSLLSPSLNTGDAAGDTYSNIRGLTGSQFDDVLYGNNAANTVQGGDGHDVLFGLDGADHLMGGAGDDVLYGGDKNDRLEGGDGNDWLFGGNGYDTLVGGAGADTFVFDPTLTGSATVADFEVGIDKVALANTGVSSLSDLQFINGTSSQGSSVAPTIVYDSVLGSVSWDPDGSGSASGYMIGKVTGGPDLSISDFVLI